MVIVQYAEAPFLPVGLFGRQQRAVTLIRSEEREHERGQCARGQIVSVTVLQTKKCLS